MTIPVPEPPHAASAPAAPRTPGDGSGFAKSWAVVVGIDAYRDGIAALRTARGDAEALGELLRERHGYRVVVRTDADATRERLLRLLCEELPARVEADDRVLFCFAGHGVALDGEGGPEGYLVPQDARADDAGSLLSMHDVHDALAGLPARHLLVVLDCCFAGAFQWYAFRHLRMAPPRLYRQHLESYVAHPARQILTSAAHDQRALDTILDGRVLGARDGGTEHSPFAQALLDGLAGAADASQGELRGDGVITATELYLYTRSRLRPDALHPEQTPQLWPMRTHGRGEFVFIPPGAPPALADAPAMDPQNNPYRGLLPFDAGQRELFFGRSRLVRELREKVARHRLVTVLGPSGSGKSSLVRAGLVPTLRDSPPEGWTVADPVRPG
ncbi:MAG TPA: caspase family protein, partial [Longimicrobium sp.]|nr:caspase family protein [Longimicrobium sp.]